MHQSIATIDSPEFINLKPLDINPLMSSCEIKVLYIGENRNHSYITKEVASDMAKTLRGAPIVGYYKNEKEDFADHGKRVILDDEGVKFECLTKPFGFVSPDAQVWFQKFEDIDDFGNKVVREYLMTTGYLWTEQYEECKSVLAEGRPQSMELDEDSLDGHWSTNNKTGMDFFIINDAIFSKLCILGDDVEPCFEGANITSPEVSTSFTKVDDDFKQTLYTMMQELRFALKGGQSSMDKDELTMEVEDSKVESVTPDVEENFSNKEEKEDIVDNAACGGKKKVKTKCEQSEEEDKEEEEMIDKDKDEADEKKKSSKYSDEDYTLLSDEYESLKAQYTELNSKYEELMNFKNEVESKQKDDLINSFYMLSDEDKKDVIEHKADYSLEDIEAKLSIICVRKKVNFDLEDSSKNDNNVEENITTYTLEDINSSVPAWISAVRNTKNSKEN